MRPVIYDVKDHGDRGIIMNKEGSYEMGLQDETGALQGAFSPCWRWFGKTRIPMHEWTHVAMAFDGYHEIHYVAGVRQEIDPCGKGEALTKTNKPLRIGARGKVSFCSKGKLADNNGCSQFQGDVDEVMLFDRGLPSSQVEGLAQHTYRAGGGMANVCEYRPSGFLSCFSHVFSAQISHRTV